MKHYEQINDIRTINNDTKHFVWHKDKYDRVIYIIDGFDWFLQMEHEIPYKMRKNQNQYIKKEVWHRIFCTNSNEDNDLVISILELNEEK